MNADTRFIRQIQKTVNDKEFQREHVRNSEKDLSKSENIKSLFSCLIFIDQFQNIQVFTTSFFKKTTNPNFEMDLNILNVVDLNLFPVKIYDYFEIFYLRISQQKKADKK